MNGYLFKKENAELKSIRNQKNFFPIPIQKESDYIEGLLKAFPPEKDLIEQMPIEDQRKAYDSLVEQEKKLIQVKKDKISSFQIAVLTGVLITILSVIAQMIISSMVLWKNGFSYILVLVALSWLFYIQLKNKIINKNKKREELLPSDSPLPACC